MGVVMQSDPCNSVVSITLWECQWHGGLFPRTPGKGLLAIFSNRSCHQGDPLTILYGLIEFINSDSVLLFLSHLERN